MSEKGAGYFATAKQTVHTREELKERVAELREDFDISDEELRRLIDDV